MSKINPKNIHKRLSKHMLVDHFDVVFDLEKSKGQYLFDSKSNRALLDCFSFIASNPIGHNHPSLSDKDFEKKLLRAAKTNPSNADILSIEFGEFVETFARVAKPKEFKHLFFIAGGSAAVENALKAAFDWKIGKLKQKDPTQVPDANKLEVVHFINAFHGRGGYAVSTTNTDPTKYKDFPKFKWPRFFAPTEGPNFEREFEKTKSEIQKYVAAKKDSIAAILIEGLSGEGGNMVSPPEFHRFLREITKENDILLVYDEVQSGVGLTGKMWAYQNYGIVPDLVAFGKKAQVCGVMATKRLDEVKDNVFVTSSRISSTWGGNLTDMVRSQRYLEVIEQEKLVNNAKVVGKFIVDGLTKLQKNEDLKIKVSNVRGLGLMLAFDVSIPKETFLKKMLSAGVLALPCGNSIRVRPSLNFSKKDATDLLKILETICKG